MMFLNEVDQVATCEAMLIMGSESKKTGMLIPGSNASFADLYYLFAGNY